MYHWVHKAERHHQKAHRRVNVFPLVSETVFWCQKRLSFSLHPSLLPPTLSHAPSIARHAADELKESMSVGRQGGEKKKRKTTSERIHSVSFSTRNTGWDLAASWAFSRLGGSYLGQSLGLRIHLDLSTQYFQLGSTKTQQRNGTYALISIHISIPSQQPRGALFFNKQR